MRNNKGFQRNNNFKRNNHFDRGPRKMHKAICSECKEECEVPFKPTEGRDVFCKECYAKNGPRKSSEQKPEPKKEETSATKPEESVEEGEVEEDASEEDEEVTQEDEDASEEVEKAKTKDADK